MNFIKIQNTMKQLTLILMFSLWLPVAHAGQDQQCKADIQILLNSYQQALNDNNADKVTPLYTDDGIFMPANKPTAMGSEQVKTAYQNVFKAIDLNIEFHIDEIEHHGNIAFVRTTSDGEIKILDKNITIKNNNREIFIMKRINNKWKIYRYIFNEVS